MSELTGWRALGERHAIVPIEYSKVSDYTSFLVKLCRSAR